MKKWIYTTAVLVTTVLTTGCEYKDLGEAGEYTREVFPLSVTFDWSKVDSIPEAMRVAFYPHDGNITNRGYTFFDILNKDTVVQIPGGIYDIVAWNNDCEHVLTGGYGAVKSIYGTTTGYSPHGDYVMPQVLDSIFGGQEVLDYPDYMVHAIKMPFEVAQDGTTKQVTLQPDSMVITVDVKLHKITSLDKCKAIRGAVNNVAGKRLVAYDNRTEQKVSVVFDAEWDEKENCVHARFWLFGKEPSEEGGLTHKMVMFFWLNGGRAYLPLDITELIKKQAKDNRHIAIDIRDLNVDLKDYIKQAGGFDIGVDDWDNIDINIDF